MRTHLIPICLALLFALAASAASSAQSPENKTDYEKADSSADTKKSDAPSQLQSLFEFKVKAEWEAIKKKDKKAYADLLADDYQGVEVDNQGERTKIQALNELAASNVSDYTLWGFKLISLSPDAAFLVYESTIQFPPKSVLRFSRVYISELWVKRNAEWRLLHYQETHVK